jgi:hypothetical protein
MAEVSRQPVLGHLTVSKGATLISRAKLSFGGRVLLKTNDFGSESEVSSTMGKLTLAPGFLMKYCTEVALMENGGSVPHLQLAMSNSHKAVIRIDRCAAVKSATPCRRSQVNIIVIINQPLDHCLRSRYGPALDNE